MTAMNRNKMHVVFGHEGRDMAYALGGMTPPTGDMASGSKSHSTCIAVSTAKGMPLSVYCGVMPPDEYPNGPYATFFSTAAPRARK